MTVSYFSFLNIIINIVESPNAWRLLEIAFLSLNHCFFWLSLTWLGSVSSAVLSLAWLLTQVQIAIIQSYTIQSWALNWQLPVLILLGHVSSHILMVGTTIACLLNRIDIS